MKIWEIKKHCTKNTYTVFVIVLVWVAKFRSRNLRLALVSSLVQKPRKLFKNSTLLCPILTWILTGKSDLNIGPIEII